MDTTLKNTNSVKSDIRQSRINALSKGYQKSTLAGYSFETNVSGECSDMCSGACHCHGGENHKHCSVHYPS